MIIKDLGAVSAYAYAVGKGYTGTEEEFATLMASYASVAEEAAESAESASQSATTAQTAAQTATTKAGEASTSATQAGASATSASQSASTATTKASEASASASTASTKASEASTSASTASSKASEASASATSAQTAQGLAESARDDAIDAKTDAETARDLAQQYAESINPENIFSAYPTDTASGSVASFADGADDIPMKSVVVNIEPVQSGSGDPSPDNVRPISGWTGAQVVRVGVNVWDEEWEVGGISSVDGSKYRDVNRIRSKNFIPVKPSTPYYFKMPSTFNAFKVAFYGVNKAFLSLRVFKNDIITTPPNCYWLMLSENTTDYGTTYNHDISINYPSTDHDYHPFTGSDTYSITFPAEAGTVYGGELDVTNGTLTVDMAMVDLGTLNWSYVGGTSGVKYFRSEAVANAKRPSANTEATDAIFSTYATIPAYDVYLGNIGGGIETVSNVRICDPNYTDATTFKTAMDGVQLCYELATPITYTLTPTEIKSLLGDNNIWADAGDTEVTYRADPNLYIEKKLGTEAPMIADSNIVSGSYFMIGNNLYKATANIANGAAVVVGTNAVAITMAEALNEINA